MDIGADDNEFEFTNVGNRICNIQESDNVRVHNKCHSSFLSSKHLEHKESKYKRKNFVSQNLQSDINQEENLPGIDLNESLDRKSSRKSVDSTKNICFICYKRTAINNNPYNSGELGRCTEERASIKSNSSIQVLQMATHFTKPLNI